MYLCLCIMRSKFTVAVFMLLAAGCGSTGGRASSAAGVPEQASDPVYYTYRVKAVYPHAVDSYTQGLQYADGYMWEGTGMKGESRLLRTDLQSGVSEVIYALPSRFFGEGIALLGDRIYQLTWEEGTAFVYDRSTLRKTGELYYNGEGWGLATDGGKLYMTDGTNHIYRLNPDTFEREGTISVTLKGQPVHYLNEIEWIDGHIWANVYLTDTIVIIDPSTGRVTGVIDLGGLLPEEEHTPQTDVLNGIAYDADGKRIFVTGKNWSRLFEIEIVER